jgi:hypothetical protein
MEPNVSLLCSQESVNGPYPNQMNLVHNFQSNLINIMIQSTYGFS